MTDADNRAKAVSEFNRDQLTLTQAGWISSLAEGKPLRRACALLQMRQQAFGI